MASDDTVGAFGLVSGHVLLKLTSVRVATVVVDEPLLEQSIIRLWRVVVSVSHALLIISTCPSLKHAFHSFLCLKPRPTHHLPPCASQAAATA